MLVSFASGVSTKISLFFHTSFRIPCNTSHQDVHPGIQATYHVIPCCHNRLHVKITGEEGNDAIRNNFTVLNKDTAKIPDNGWIIPDLETRTYSDLIATASNDLHPSYAVVTCEYDQPLTNGRKALRVSVIGYVSCTTGVNCSIFGYMSSGEIVPEVITTLLKCSKTGLIASEGSRHLSQSQKTDSITNQNTDVK